MKIEYNSTFRKNFGVIWDFISNDSIKRADNFKNQLKSKILNLPNSPYKFRQSHYYEVIAYLNKISKTIFKEKTKCQK